jgi:hypothetical protein
MSHIAITAAGKITEIFCSVGSRKKEAFDVEKGTASHFYRFAVIFTNAVHRVVIQFLKVFT